MVGAGGGGGSFQQNRLPTFHFVSVLSSVGVKVVMVNGYYSGDYNSFCFYCSCSA